MGASFASTCTTGDCSHMQSENLFAAPAPVPTEKALLPNQAIDSRQIDASKAKPAPSAKKPTRGSLSPTELDGGDDACPVAVYVDLSASRTRKWHAPLRQSVIVAFDSKLGRCDQISGKRSMLLHLCMQKLVTGCPLIFLTSVLVPISRIIILHVRHKCQQSTVRI